MSDSRQDQHEEQLLGARDAQVETEDEGQHIEMDPPTHPLPESIYGAGIIYLILAFQSTNGRIHGKTLLVVSAVVANVLMQVYVLVCIMYYITQPSVAAIRKTYSSYHSLMFDDDGTFKQDAFDNWDDDDLNTLCQFPFSQLQFFLVILVIWTAYIIIDVKETIYLIVVTWALPSPAQGNVGTNASKHSEGYSEGDGIIIEDLSMPLKAGITGLVLLPKLGIAAFLWWIGARWLAATPCFQDLVLNSLALAFITDLDEVVYQALLPLSAMEVVTTHTLHRTPYQHRNSRLTHNLALIAFKAIVVAGLPWVYVHYLQQVIPGYKFDVAVHCKSYLHKFLTGEES